MQRSRKKGSERVEAESELLDSVIVVRQACGTIRASYFSIDQCVHVTLADKNGSPVTELSLQRTSLLRIDWRTLTVKSIVLQTGNLLILPQTCQTSELILIIK